MFDKGVDEIIFGLIILIVSVRTDKKGLDCFRPRDYSVQGVLTGGSTKPFLLFFSLAAQTLRPQT